MTPKELVNAAERKDLDGIVVTDHDTTSAVEKVREEAEDLEVISGVEISTSEGHMLGIDIQEAPEPGLDPEDAVKFVKEREGIVILAHPFDKLRENFTPDTLERLSDSIDAVESTNSRTIIPSFNKSSSIYADSHGLPKTAGSDAHFHFEVGRAYTYTEQPLLQALESGEVEPRGRGLYLSGHIYTKMNDLLKSIL
jgi:predicted metal-dependent phosphoesterase TrpH